MKTILKSINNNKLIGMNILLNNNFDNRYVNIMEPTKNFVIRNGYFYKFIYLTDEIKLTNLIFELKLTNVNIVKQLTNKYILYFEKNKDNLKELSKVIDIERLILEKLQLKFNNRPSYELSRILQSNSIRIYTNNNLSEKYNTFSLKIKFSGVWKDKERYGVTYKFLN
tara:strand:- start:9052 stop:9555 length:504 start_codon:yes stop_codon:yes gene_type:complete